MHCLTCGYDLQQLEDNRCPECGRGFSRDDATTYGSVQSHRLLRWAKRVGWSASLISAGVGVTAALGMATGRHDLMILIMLWMFAAFPVVLACMAFITLITASGRSPSVRAIAVAIVLFTFNASLLTEWPIRVAFYLHRDALNRLAQKVGPNSTVITPQHVGLYTIDGISYETTPSGIHVYMHIHGGDGPDYFVYGLTDQEIENHFNIWSYKRLDENWHIVHED